jgi:hypothetical protein
MNTPVIDTGTLPLSNQMLEMISTIHAQFANLQITQVSVRRTCSSRTIPHVLSDSRLGENLDDLPPALEMNVADEFCREDSHLARLRDRFGFMWHAFSNSNTNKGPEKPTGLLNGSRLLSDTLPAVRKQLQPGFLEGYIH